jgi:FdhE protein
VRPRETLAELERRLERLSVDLPELAEPIALQAGLIRARVEMLEPDLPPLRLAAHVAADRLRSGAPLLHQTPAFVDIGWSAGLFGRLVDVAARQNANGALEAIVSALDEGVLDLEALFTEAFVQHREHVAQIAADADVDADQLASLAWLAVAPLLAAYAAQLAPFLERGLGAWDRGYCPVCGAWPGLAERRGIQRLRHLRCLSCGTGWPAPSGVCAYCGAVDEVQRLGVQGEPRFGIEECDRCRGYLKTVRAFDPSPTVLLPLDDLASVHVDRLAQERGYARPSGPGFPIDLADDALPVHLA